MARTSGTESGWTTRMPREDAQPHGPGPGWPGQLDVNRERPAGVGGPSRSARLRASNASPVIDRPMPRPAALVVTKGSNMRSSLIFQAGALGSPIVNMDAPSRDAAGP